MSRALEPTFGIQLTPPAIGALAYFNMTIGPPDKFTYALVS